MRNSPILRRSLAGALAASLAIATDAWACSQCLCGTPFPADALGAQVPGRVRFGLEERYLSKSNALEDAPGVEREREHRVSAFAAWRPAPWIAVRASLPYNVKEITEHPDGETASIRESRGIGDAEGRALVRVGGLGRGSVAALAGVVAPTGANGRANAVGERLDEHLQPGSGAWSATAGFQLVVPTTRGMLDGSLIGRANGRNSNGYAYGNALLFNAGYASPTRSGWALMAEINGRSARRDRLDDGSPGEHTGGTVVYVTPGARWIGSGGFGLEAELQIPAVQSLFGDQREHATARVACSAGF